MLETKKFWFIVLFMILYVNYSFWLQRVAELQG